MRKNSDLDEDGEEEEDEEEQVHVVGDGEDIMAPPQRKLSSFSTVRQLSFNLFGPTFAAAAVDAADDDLDPAFLPKSRATLLRRQSSMREYVVDPYFRLVLHVQPLVESMLDWYAALDDFVVLHQETILNAMALLLVFFGLLVTFYGSHVSRTISFVSAFRNDRLQANLSRVRDQLFTSKRKLESLPANRQVKKLMVILSELDPNIASDIASDCWRSILFAGATAKLDHAKTISLGLVLGEHLNRPMQRYLVPVLMGETRQEFARWYVVLFTHTCALLGVAFAFQIEALKILGMISTSVKGAHMIVTNAAHLFRHRAKLSPGLEDALVAALVLLGLASQALLLHREHVPLVLQLIWFPIFLVENYLVQLVRWM